MQIPRVAELQRVDSTNSGLTVSGFVLLSQLSQGAVGKLNIFIVRGLLGIKQFIQSSFSVIED